MLIAFCGPKRSGKDTCSNYIVDKYGFKRLSFADRIRKVANVLYNLSDDFDWDINKEDPCAILGGNSRRYVMQSIGEAMKPTLGRNIWINSVMSGKDFDRRDYVLTDLRFPEELYFIQRNNGLIVYLQRTANVHVEKDTHVSESYLGLLYSNASFTIFTDDKQEKLRQVAQVMDDLGIAPVENFS